MHAHSIQGERRTGRPLRPLLLAAVLFVLAGCLVAAPVPFGATAQAQAACANKIACENEAAGTDDWQVSNFDDTIVGLHHRHQRHPRLDGQLQGQDRRPGYSVDIYRLGYYQGKARAVHRAPRPGTAASRSPPA